MKKVFSCDVCSKTFDKQSRLVRHQDIHNKAGYTCENCNKVYQHIDKFENHQEKCRNSDITTQMNIDGAEMDIDFDSLPVSMIDFVQVNTNDYEESNEPDDETVNKTDENEAGTEIHRNTIGKKTRNLTAVLNNIKVLAHNDQAKILRKSFNALNSDATETLMMTDINQVNEAKVATGVLEYLKGLNICTSRDQMEFCYLAFRICGENLQNDVFLRWFSKRVNKRLGQLEIMMERYFSASSDPVKRGRKGMPVNIKQYIFDA